MLVTRMIYVWEKQVAPLKVEAPLNKHPTSLPHSLQDGSEGSPGCVLPL